MYIVASVALVLAQARIEPFFAFSVIAYVGQCSAMPLRQSVPVTLLVFAAFLLNHFGQQKLVSWSAGDWFSVLMQAVPAAGLILFLGRMVITSSERGRLIMELETARQALELSHQREAELAVLQERERLARDLHDSLGHSLVTLTVQLEAAQRLIASEPARAAASLEEMQKLTRASMEDLRRSLANLRAPGLGESTLSTALHTLCTETGKRTGASIRCAVEEKADRLPPRATEVLWRVAQEGLMNVEKHARAQNVHVTLALLPKEVQLRVGDDGIGVGADAEDKPGHYGLRGLRERVEGLGGTFTLTSLTPKGSLLEACLPIIG